MGYSREDSFYKRAITISCIKVKQLKYFYYKINCRDDGGVWDIKDVAYTESVDVLREEIKENLNPKYHPTLAELTEIPKYEFQVLVKYL